MEFQPLTPSAGAGALALGLALLLAGATTLVYSLFAARRRGLFTSSFWLTFGSFAAYRSKRLVSLVFAAAGLILLIWGARLVIGFVLAYYAARLGHPA
jgi:hypothetical protein